MSFKTLYILRHAKAVPAEGAPDDHERPLNARGEQDALKIGAYLRANALVPQLVLCSTSLRTRQTLHLIEKALDYPLNVRYLSQLYLASPKEVADILSALEESVQSVMVIGHNPTLHQFAVEMTASGESMRLNEMLRRFPTAALAEIHYPAAEWSEIGPRKGVLKRFVIPSELP